MTPKSTKKDTPIKGDTKDPKKGAVVDSLINVMSGLGTETDKNAYSRFGYAGSRSYEELGAIFAGTSIARKIVEIIPGDMTRQWRSWEESTLDPKKIEEFQKEEKRLSVRAKVREALGWARLYGGALLVPILTTPEKDLRQPLSKSSIKKNTLAGFTVVDAKYAHATGQIGQDPTKPSYMMPEQYTLTGTSGSSIHYSRVIRFDGLKLPRDLFQSNRYWSQSVLDSVFTELRNSTLVSESLATLMNELNLDIINIKGLSNSLAAGREADIKQRFEVYNFIKSMFHTAILDEDEKFSNRVAPAQGVGELIDKFYGLLAGVTDIPVTRFLGVSPGGLNATGESDLTNYYDNIKDKQETTLSPAMRDIDTMIALSLWGEVPEGLHDYTWVGLWQEKPKEKADRELVDAQRDALYLDKGIVTEDKVLQELMQNKVYSNIEQSDVDNLADIINQQEEAGDGFETNTTIPENSPE
jgi:phage-related protein (TIGR01555 family)